MNRKRKMVLLIDDESSIRRNLALSLNQLGYDTEPAEDGVSGLKKLDMFMKHDITPAAVVLDIQLPDILGTKLATIIKFRYPGVPVILITGFVDKLNPEEIVDMNIKALVQKPFNAEQLVEHFVETPAEAVQPEAEIEEDISRSGYLLVKLEKGADFAETYKNLYFMDNVVYCDATRGDHDIFMLIQGGSMDEIRSVAENQVPNLEGVADVKLLEVGNPFLDDATTEVLNAAEDALSEGPSGFGKERKMSNKVCSYILLDVEKEKLDKVYPTLKLDENVVFCDYTSGDHSIVLFVQGSFYTDIDRFIEERVLPIDGILKVKKFPVVNLFEM